MKKIIFIALALAVVFCLPLTASAKADFELGGYIRMDAIWNSQAGMNHALSAFCLRSNGVNTGATSFLNASARGVNHGRLQMNANATRFNLTMKGPEVWGGKVTGFIEVDFDGQAVNQPGNTFDSSFMQAKLRLRHAMFKIAWPDREVLFGQYWSMNSEMTPDTADSGGYCLYGATQLRLPQVRYTQKFAEYFSASLALEEPQNGRWGLNVDAFNTTESELSETPMVEAKIRYEQDLYGKAAWGGAPRGFYVGLGAGYFRSRNAATNFGAATMQTFGFNNYLQTTNTASNFFATQRYHDHWLFLIENFTPIIPTVSKSLAGTLGLAHQWWIGQGVSAWRLDLPGADRYYTFSNAVNPGAANSNLNYDMHFIKRFGGWAQLQYYWTNEIYTNLNFGFEKAFGFNGFKRDSWLANNPYNFAVQQQAGFVFGAPVGFDPVRSTWRASITQWYRPVSAVKFGLQYAYLRTDYFQTTSTTGVAANPNNLFPQNQSDNRKYGECHSLMANAWYMF